MKAVLTRNCYYFWKEGCWNQSGTRRWSEMAELRTATSVVLTNQSGSNFYVGAIVWGSWFTVSLCVVVKSSVLSSKCFDGRFLSYSNPKLRHTGRRSLWLCEALLREMKKLMECRDKLRGAWTWVWSNGHRNCMLTKRVSDMCMKKRISCESM